MGATGASSSGSYDQSTVDGFGFEWSVYDQEDRDPESIQRSFDRYFASFPWQDLPDGATGIDVGCGSGRWSERVVARGRRVVAIDAAPAALAVAARRLPGTPLVNGSAVELPLQDDSLDFAFSLGVLHHLPDTEGALREIHRVLRPGAPFLVYLYYAFDNRPAWFRAIWRVSDTARWLIARLPERIRLMVTRAIAAVVYWPLARLARLVARTGRDVQRLPLSSYRDQPYYVMQTDALDRFGTRLEKRYTRSQIEELLVSAGFGDVEFNEDWPYWCARARA
jgi:SAM-dependent methyltransferase